MLACVGASPRTMSAVPLLLVTIVVSGAETYRSGRALIDGVFRSALGGGGLPVSRSVARERDARGPTAAKWARSSASVTSYGRLPTNRRTAITGFSSVKGV